MALVGPMECEGLRCGDCFCGMMNDWDGESFILAAERMLVHDAETCFGPRGCVTGVMRHVVGRGDAMLRC